MRAHRICFQHLFANRAGACANGSPDQLFKQTRTWNPSRLSSTDSHREFFHLTYPLLLLMRRRNSVKEKKKNKEEIRELDTIRSKLELRASFFLKAEDEDVKRNEMELHLVLPHRAGCSALSHVAVRWFALWRLNKLLMCGLWINAIYKHHVSTNLFNQK